MLEALLTLLKIRWAHSAQVAHRHNLNIQAAA